MTDGSSVEDVLKKFLMMAGGHEGGHDGHDGEDHAAKQMFMMLFNDMKAKFEGGDFTMADAMAWIESEAKALRPDGDIEGLMNQFRSIEKPEQLLDALM